MFLCFFLTRSVYRNVNKYIQCGFRIHVSLHAELKVEKIRSSSAKSKTVFDLWGNRTTFAVLLGDFDLRY